MDGQSGEKDFGESESRSVYFGPTSFATEFIRMFHVINSFYATAPSVLQVDPEFVREFVGRCENLKKISPVLLFPRFHQ